MTEEAINRTAEINARISEIGLLQSGIHGVLGADYLEQLEAEYEMLTAERNELMVGYPSDFSEPEARTHDEDTTLAIQAIRGRAAAADYHWHTYFNLTEDALWNPPNISVDPAVTPVQAPAPHRSGPAETDEDFTVIAGLIRGWNPITVHTPIPPRIVELNALIRRSSGRYPAAEARHRAEIQSILDSTPPPEPPRDRLLDQIKASHKCLLIMGGRLEFLRDGFSIKWTTDKIVLEEDSVRINLGKFDAELRYKGGTFKALAYAQEPNNPRGSEKTTHPHVQEDRICLGDGHVDIYEAIKKGQFDLAMDITNSVLHYHDGDSAFCAVKDWFGQLVNCTDCGERLYEPAEDSEDDEETRHCYCGLAVCEGCVNYCDDGDHDCCSNHHRPCKYEDCEHGSCSSHCWRCGKCQEAYCEEHQGRCEGCGRDRCLNCLSGSCSLCGGSYCEGCLLRGKCVSCRDQELLRDLDADPVEPVEQLLPPPTSTISDVYFNTTNWFST